MLKKLLFQLFEKLGNESENNSKSKNGKANYFIEVILEEKFGKTNYVSAKTLIAYYDKYVERKENKAGEPPSELKNLISQYLDFENYHDFEEKNTSTKKGLFTLKNTKVKSAGITTAILLATGIVSYNSFHKNENCLQWNENHYEKIECINDVPNPLLATVNIETFKKIEVNDSTVFFKYGTAIIWYGKSVNGDMEYFNSGGLHPETMKHLKPITTYIINKYIKH